MICFVHWWNSRFAVSRITSQLSALRLTNQSGSLYSMAAKNYAIYKAFFLAYVIALYLVLVEERAIVACCFD